MSHIRPKEDHESDSFIIPGGTFVASTKLAMSSKATEPKFSIEQVAKILGGLHPTTVLRLLQKRKLGYYQFGSRKLVGQSHLDNYVSLAERSAKAKSIH